VRFKRDWYHFTAWLSQFVRHVALNQQRKRYRRKAVSLDALPMPIADPSRVDASRQAVGRDGALREDHGDFDDRLTRALETLKPIARACLMLRTVENMDYDEIAALLEVPRGTAMSHVFRARQTLRQQLAPTYPPETPSAPSEATLP